MANATIENKLKLLLVVLALFTGMPWHCFAGCLDPSPTVVGGDDPYAAIASRDLTPAERDTIKALFTSLDGEWRGSAHDLYCRGLKDPDDNRRYADTVKADVAVDHTGNFYLRMSLYSPQKRSTRQEILRFYLIGKRLRVNSPSTAGDVELIDVQTNRLAFLYRLLLQSDTSKGSIRKEIFIALETGDNTFSVEQQIYSQGRLSAEKIWRLSRR